MSYYIESRISGRWIRLSSKRYSAERAANLIANLVAEVEIADASSDYRAVAA